MLRCNLPCDCENEEHEVEVEAERGYGSSIGLYEPGIGDELPCGRLLEQKDMDYIYEWLNDYRKDEP